MSLYRTLLPLLGLLLLAPPLRAAEDGKDDDAVAEDGERELNAGKDARRRTGAMGLTDRAALTARPTAANREAIQRQLDAAREPVAQATKPARPARAGARGASASADDGTSGGASSSGATEDSPDTFGDGKRKAPNPLPEDTMVHLDYDNVDIKDIIKDFAEKTGRNFLIDSKLSAKITIISPNPIPMDLAYQAFIAALDANGFTTVVEIWGKSSTGKRLALLTRVIKQQEAMTEPIDLYKSGVPSSVARTSHLITRLLKVENVPVDELSKIIQKMVSANGNLIAYAPNNMLIITDSANNIKRIVELVRELDISAPQQKLEVIPIKYAEAARVMEIISEIYGADGATKSKASKAKTARNKRSRKKKAPRPTSGSATSVGDQGSFISKMIADDRTNSIIVLATETSLGEIKKLIAEIDYEVDPWAQSDIHVVYLEHAKSEDLAQTLNNLVQESNSRAQQAKKKAKKKTKTRAKSGATTKESGNFSGEIRITNDVPTNSLVITASRDDFIRLRRVINMLDIPRKQVFVETVIMELSDEDKHDTGVSWHGGYPSADSTNPVGLNILGAHGSNSINLSSAFLDGSLLAGMALGVFGNGINIPVPGVEGGLEIPAFGLVIKALQEDTGTNVLSAPNILTMDNEEASIEIGETVPFPTGGSMASMLGGAASAASGFGFPSVSFTREDVGIILRITPQVNESDHVTMEIYQEISEVKEGSAGDSTLSSGGPRTTKRSAETVVNVMSNQTIVIGGLMQEVETESESKVPILGDIPLLGALFRSKIKRKRKTNLLIFLTPHVIDDPEDLQEVYRIKMLQRQEFIRRFYGKSADQQANELNELLSYSMNLPEQPSEYRDRKSKPRSHYMMLDEALESQDIEDEEDEEYGLGDDTLLITPEGESHVADEPFPDADSSFDEEAAADDEPAADEPTGEQPEATEETGD